MTNSTCQRHNFSFLTPSFYDFYLQVGKKRNLFNCLFQGCHQLAVFLPTRWPGMVEIIELLWKIIRLAFQSVEVCNLSFKHPLCHLPALSPRLIPACSQIRGNWQQQIRSHKSLASRWSAAAGKARVRHGCVNPRSPRCCSHTDPAPLTHMQDHVWDLHPGHKLDFWFQNYSSTVKVGDTLKNQILTWSSLVFIFSNKATFIIVLQNRFWHQNMHVFVTAS